MTGHSVILSLASNHDAKENLFKARHRLEEILPMVSFTRELWTEPIGTKQTDLYLNQLAWGRTSASVEELNAQLKQIEKEHGRTAEDRLSGTVRLDLDLLQYDEKRYHAKDWSRPYVTELTGDLPHDP